MKFHFLNLLIYKMGICFSELSANSNQEAIAIDRPQVEQINNQKKSRLSQIDPKTVPKVIFQDKIVDVFVYNCVDGDTIHFLMDIGSDVPAKLALRMIGIDTPEIHAGKDKLPQEKIAAKIAKEYLKSLVQGHTKIRISDWDKFGGRCLGEVVLADGQTANQMMIKGGYARPYQGEKKRPWTLEELTSPPFNVTSRDIELFVEGN